MQLPVPVDHLPGYTPSPQPSNVVPLIADIQESTAGTDHIPVASPHIDRIDHNISPNHLDSRSNSPLTKRTRLNSSPHRTTVPDPTVCPEGNAHTTPSSMVDQPSQAIEGTIQSLQHHLSQPSNEPVSVPSVTGSITHLPSSISQSFSNSPCHTHKDPHSGSPPPSITNTANTTSSRNPPHSKTCQSTRKYHPITDPHPYPS